MAEKLETPTLSGHDAPASYAGLFQLAHQVHSEAIPETAPRPAEARTIASVVPPSTPTLDPDSCQRAFPILHPNCRREYLEQFRQLRNRVYLERRDRSLTGAPLRSLAILSPAAGDGKSFIAGNLAAALASAVGNRVLLLDASTSRGRWKHLLGFEHPEGLSEVLNGSQEWQSVIRRVPDLELYVMTLGAERATALDQVDLHRLPELLEKLHSAFDWIVLDGPAFADSADAELIGHLADASLLVVRKARTPFASLTGAIEQIPRARQLGVVLNSQARSFRVR
jgi:Mrp family chromosome partitioning ATPase